MNEIKIFKFEKYGRVILPIYLQPTQGTILKTVDMKVDTGADFSTISKEDLSDLGYDTHWINQNVITGDKYNMITAAGEIVVVGLVQLPIVNILGYEAKKWPFRVAMNEKRDFRNLLGRDLLAGFDYTFRNSLNQFEINRIGKFVPLYEFIKGQAIYEVSA